MKPTVRLHSIAFALATAIVYTVWTKVFELMQLNAVYKVLLGGLISLGLYRLVASGIIYLTKKSTWIKRQFLGPYFLEGTWVGFYIGVSGNERFIIEKFEQEIDSLTIHGKSFSETTKYHASWTSTSVNIDPTNRRITYMYDCLPINDKTSTNGIAIFTLERDDQYSAAKGLTGFSADLHLGQRVRAMETKLSVNCNIDEMMALEEAKKFFEANKDNF